MRNVYLLILILFLGAYNNINAQDTTEVILASDTIVKKSVWKKIYNYFADANKPKNKKFDVSIIGGPHYSSDVKVGLGIVAAGLYSTNRKDSLTPISNVSLYGDVTTTGFYLIGIRGNNIFEREKWRIDYSLYFFSFPSAFWGLGYVAGNNDANASRYKRKQARTKFDFLFKVAPKFYIGPSVGFEYASGTDLHNPDLIAGFSNYTRALEYGFTAIYDSRDFIPNPYKGIYVKVQQRNFTYPGRKPFFKTNLQFDAYQRAWKGAIFAFDVYTESGYGDTPWTTMANIGGSYRMRGYYEGRYRDNNMVTMQVEYRQKIYNRHGIVLWGGLGNVWGHDKFSWDHTLPNYGVGYRWEFKNRVNVRLDYGFGKSGQNSFMFGIYEAF